MTAATAQKHAERWRSCIQRIPEYRDVPIRMIEESREPELADQYDYYAVPSFFDGEKKLFEAHLFMSYEDIREEVRRVLDYARTELPDDLSA